eukprot:SAG11_NODE_3255_length_2576_cov_1.721437_3_plen_137_part_00
MRVCLSVLNNLMPTHFLQSAPFGHDDFELIEENIQKAATDNKFGLSMMKGAISRRGGDDPAVPFKIEPDERERINKVFKVSRPGVNPRSPDPSKRRGRVWTLSFYLRPFQDNGGWGKVYRDHQKKNPLLCCCSSKW